jgi:methionyl-tRNA synthetase
LGNVIDPFTVIKKYGTDAVRYYLLREIPSYGDGDFSEQRFKEIYNADLANGLGNLVARTASLAIKYFSGKVPGGIQDPYKKPSIPLIEIERKTGKKYNEALKEYKFDEALEAVWRFIEACDKYIDQEKPWELAKKNDPRLSQMVYNLLECLHQIVWMLLPAMPGTALEIARRLNLQTILKKNPVSKDDFIIIPPGNKVTTGPSLFPRL